MTEETKKEPVEHPGEILLMQFMRPRHMRIAELAYAMGCSIEHLASLIAENRDITYEDAVSLAHLFSTSIDFWLWLQKRYDDSTPGSEQLEAVDNFAERMLRFELKHPGVLLWEYYMEPRGMSTAELADHLGKSPEYTRSLLQGQCDITPIVAYYLAYTFETSKEYWLNLQRDYDLRMKNGPTT
ncbi:HigA family addiction module antitoxin [Thiolapillus sp.]|uniref:HigA family addiction module antitoxin n=1 Tax=Thiolapillus sp. TaxID=2017437 RepID=UPI003AF675F8